MIWMTGYMAVVGLRVRPRIYIVIFERLVVVPWSGLQVRLNESLNGLG